MLERLFERALELIPQFAHMQGPSPSSKILTILNVNMVKVPRQNSREAAVYCMINVRARSGCIKCINTIIKAGANFFLDSTVYRGYL